MEYQDGEYPADWWMTHKTELPVLSRFAIFILGAPVQGADCERLFKDLASFHTKSRNRMHNTTTFDSAAVAHSLRRNYAEDYEKNSGSKTRNRFIEPAEFEKKDALLSPTRQVPLVMEVPMRQPSQTQTVTMRQPSQLQTQSPQACSTPLSLVRDTRSDAEEESKESEDDDDGEELDLTCNTHMEIWLKMLTLNVDDDDSVMEEDLYGTGEEEDAVDSLLATMEDDHDCEIQQYPLPPLPLINDPKYPQEDRHYFKTKKYVRNDKYTLEHLVSLLKTSDGTYELPSIMSGYGIKAKSW